MAAHRQTKTEHPKEAPKGDPMKTTQTIYAVSVNTVNGPQILSIEASDTQDATGQAMSYQGVLGVTRVRLDG